MKQTCTTVHEFIDALGGTGSAARVFGVGPSAISNWKASGRFPDRVHLQAYLLAASMKIKLDERLLTRGAQ